MNSLDLDWTGLDLCCVHMQQGTFMQFFLLGLVFPFQQYIISLIIVSFLCHFVESVCKS